ncbi:MAG: caspase family protein [Elusimicrobia bacterium]|nr:caspase family protein [Elusimicrobiota bacterium]
MNRVATAALFLTLPFLAACASTPLNDAIARKDFAEVKRLVDSGADLQKGADIRPVSTPLVIAVTKGTPEIATYLAKKGAGTVFTAVLNTHDRPDMLDALLDGGVEIPPKLASSQRIQAALRRHAARNAPPSHESPEEAYARGRAPKSAPPEKKEMSSDIDAPVRRGAERPDDFALVIGIEEYQSVPKADYGARDAKTVRRHLEALGFPSRNIISLTGPEATGSKLRSYLEEWLPLNVKENSTLFVYYSGHGAPDIKTGDAYLVPWDGDPKFLKSTALPLTKLYSDLSKTKAKRVIVALDACFSGAGGRSVLAKGARPLIAKIADTAPVGGNLTVLAAASGDEITGSLDDQGHGMFTYYLLKGLEADPKASAKSLFQYVMPRVQDDARRQNRVQTPVLAGASLSEPLLP